MLRPLNLQKWELELGVGVGGGGNIEIETTFASNLELFFLGLRVFHLGFGVALFFEMGF